MNRDLIIITISMLTWGIGEGAFVYFQPIYLEQLGAQPILIGAILGVMGVFMTIAHIPAGYLADRIGRRTILWISWGLGLTASLFMASAKSLPIFVVGMLLYGLTAFVISPLNSYISAARGNLSVTRVLTSVSAFYNLGAVVGPILGGIIGERYGIRSIYRFSTLIFLISTLLVFNIKKQPVELQEKGAINGLLTNKKFRTFLVVIFIVMFTMYLPQPLSPNFLQNERGIELITIGTIGAVGNFGSAIISLVLGSWSPLIGIMIGQVSVAFFALILWRGNSITWYSAGYFLLGGYRAARSLAIAHVNSLVSRDNMGLAYGIAETVSGFGIILAPPLAGYLYGREPVSIYQVSILMLSLSLILSFILTPRRGKEKQYDLGN